MISHLKHYAKILKKITESHYSGKASLLLCYFRLIAGSYWLHKNPFRKNINQSPLTEKIGGFTVYFFSYPQLLDLFEEIFIYEVYKFASVKSNPIIVDCGSNIGISILYFKKIFPSSRILAFEPDYETFRLLEMNVLKNKITGISLFNLALSDTDGEALLYKRNLFPGNLSMGLIPSSDNRFSQTVLSGKLSDYVSENVDLIKIDTEGSELKIVEDLLISAKINLIGRMIIEFHPLLTKVASEDFMTMIGNHNFSCHRIKDQLHPGATEVMIYCDNRGLIIN
jgi:FkbM family methyltransferase